MQTNAYNVTTANMLYTVMAKSSGAANGGYQNVEI